MSSVFAADSLHRYWPQSPLPETLLTVPMVGDHELGMTFETATGLAALALREGRGDFLVHELLENSGYQEFEKHMLAYVKPQIIGPFDTWQVVQKLKDSGLVKGYILFRYDASPRGFHEPGEMDESVNVATSLAAVLGGIAVSEQFEAEAIKLELQLLMDVRGKTEAWCLEQYADQFSKNLITTADPKARNIRSMAVALKSFVVHGPGLTMEAAMARCESDSPVLGWAVGDEYQQTMPISQWAMFQSATNWCHNLTTLSPGNLGGLPQEQLQQPTAKMGWKNLKWEEGVHYATFLMSDGDNVQWLMGNFLGGSEGESYYQNPARGEFNMGWSFPYVDLAQLSPYTLLELLVRATSRDDFVLYGGGYYYPDHFGEKRAETGDKTDYLALHAKRIGEYMHFGGLHTLGIILQDWDSDTARASYDTYSREISNLEGILTVQYYPYSGGEGKVIWVKQGDHEIPVISCAYTIWANTRRLRDTTPAGVAAALNNAPRGESNWDESNFTYVMAHAWSVFRDTNDDPSLTAEEENLHEPGAVTARGLMPVKWTIDRLKDDMRVVTPREFILQMRLHLRTRQTLTEYALQLAPQVEKINSKRADELFTRAQVLLPEVNDGDDSGRQCFELLRRVERLVERRNLWSQRD